MRNVQSKTDKELKKLRRSVKTSSAELYRVTQEILRREAVRGRGR